MARQSSVFTMLIKGLSFVWRRQKLPQINWAGSWGTGGGLPCLPPADHKRSDENDHEHHAARDGDQEDGGVGAVPDDPGGHWQGQLHKGHHLGKVLRARTSDWITSFNFLKSPGMLKAFSALHYVLMQQRFLRQP